MDGNYVKINRKILDWEWYTDINTCRLFIHMLLKANWKDGNFRGKPIPRGSFVSSIGKLSEETNLTKDEIRTAIKHLISTKEITKQSFSKYSVFTVKNYDMYQCFPNQNPKQIPSKSQSIPKLFPTIEKGKKEIREEINIHTDYQYFAGAFNQNCPSLPKVLKITDGRRNAIKTFLKHYTVEDFEKACKRIEQSDFATGRTGEWMATFDWMIKPVNTTKVLEGNYDNKKSSETKSKTKFNNFSGRNYENITEIERLLVEKGQNEKNIYTRRNE